MSAPPAAFSPVRAWLLVAALALVYAFAAADRNAINLLAEDIKRDLALDDSQIGIAAGIAFGALYVAAAPLFGWLSDRGGRKAILVGGMLVWCVLTMACGAARDFTTLVVLRMGVGLGEAALIPVAYPLIAEAMPRRRVGMATSLFVLGSLAGGALAVMAGAALLSQPASVGGIAQAVGLPAQAWRGVFVVLGASGLVMTPALLALRLPPRTALSAPPPHAADTQTRRRNPFVGLFIGFAASAIVVFSLNIWAVSLLSRRFAMSVADAGAIFGAVSLGAGVAGALASGVISDAWRKRGEGAAHFKCVLIGAFLTVPAAVAFPLAPSAALAPFALGAVLLLTTFVATLAPTVLQLVTAAHLRGRMAAGYLVTVNVIGLGLGPFLTGLLADRVFGAQGLHWAMAVVMSVGAPLAAAGFMLARRDYVALTAADGDGA